MSFFLFKCSIKIMKAFISLIYHIFRRMKDKNREKFDFLL